MTLDIQASILDKCYYVIRNQLMQLRKYTKINERNFNNLNSQRTEKATSYQLGLLCKLWHAVTAEGGQAVCG